MAEFEQAYIITAQNEGGYVNDPTDAGGETYKGISRVYNPSWDGWGLIEDFKIADDFPANLNDSELLQKSVKAFYKAWYWDRFQGDSIPRHLQDVTNEIYDIAVNMGVHRAVTFLQTALNCLNRNGESYPDVVEDGVFGPVTLSILTEFYLLGDGHQYIVKIMNILQGKHYLEFMRRKPRQERYARGWLNRVRIS